MTEFNPAAGNIVLEDDKHTTEKSQVETQAVESPSKDLPKIPLSTTFQDEDKSKSEGKLQKKAILKKKWGYGLSSSSNLNASSNKKGRKSSHHSAEKNAKKKSFSESKSPSHPSQQGNLQSNTVHLPPQQPAIIITEKKDQYVPVQSPLPSYSNKGKKNLINYTYIHRSGTKKTRFHEHYGRIQFVNRTQS